MRKVFIDCGAHCGCSVRKFRTEYKNHEEYEVYCFEANPHLIEHVSKEPNIIVNNKAVWDTDGESEFFVLKKFTSGGGTLSKYKADHSSLIETVKIETIDFSRWLIDTFSADDEIILKLDIEGAEYRVLEKMIQDESIRYINKLMGEWHDFKIGLSRSVSIALEKQLRDEYGLPFRVWDAINNNKWRCIG